MKIDAAHARLRGERDERRVQFVHLARAQSEFLLRQNDDAAALRRFVGERSQLRGIGQSLRLDARRGMKCRGHAIAQRDRAGLVEQQHVHVAGRFDGASAHRQHIALEDAVHAGDANGAEQSADGRRNQTDQQRDQNGNGKDRAGINSERLQRDADEQKDERQRREQNRQRDFVRRLLALRAFDQRNHPVEKAVALFHRDANDNAVAQHARAAGDGAAVAAALANDRRRFAGDGGFIHAGDAFDDVAVGGNDVARFAHHEVALLQIGRRNFFFAAIAQAARHRVLARFAQGWRPALCRDLRPRLRRSWRRAR